jgi:hypothetical protein
MLPGASGPLPSGTALGFGRRAGTKAQRFSERGVAAGNWAQATDIERTNVQGLELVEVCHNTRIDS